MAVPRQTSHACNLLATITMASKLAYLSKYGGDILNADDGSGGGTDVDSKRKKKSNKKSKKKTRRSDEGNYNDNPRMPAATLRDMDDMQSLPVDCDDDQLFLVNGEEGPAVVDNAVVEGMLEGGGEAAKAATSTGGRSLSSSRRRGVFDTVPIMENSTTKTHHSKANTAGKLGRRDRHDSESESSSRNGDVLRRGKKKRMHHEIIRGSGNETKESHRHRNDSESNVDDEAETRRRAPSRRRHDSDSEDDEISSKRDVADAGRRITKNTERRGRHDSDSDSNDGNIRKRYQRRHDSNSDESDIESSSKVTKVSSGHKSGLQKSEDFARTEIKIRKRQREELARLNLESANNGGGETIHRDASGKKRIVSSKLDEEQLRREEEEKEAQQRHANKGRYQRMQEERRLRELEEAANMTLARSIEDDQLEESKRSVIREGDPMAMHEWKKQQERQSKQSAMNGNEAVVSLKPVYKGPQPKPNRYSIRPGYRWDGIDRGNGFEDRVLETLHSKGRKKEEAYKWSAADM